MLLVLRFDPILRVNFMTADRNDLVGPPDGNGHRALTAQRTPPRLDELEDVLKCWSAEDHLRFTAYGIDTARFEC